MKIDFKYDLGQQVKYGEITGKVIAYYKYKNDSAKVQIEWVCTDGGLSNTWVELDELIVV